jgi:transposase
MHIHSRILIILCTSEIQKIRFPLLFPLKGFLHLVGKPGFFFLHDDPRPRGATATVNFFSSWGWEILPHPPYSPDLAPLEFHLFPEMKNHTRDQRFNSNENVQNEVKKWLRVEDAFFFYEGLDKLIYRYDSCLNSLCDYMEK